MDDVQKLKVREGYRLNDTLLDGLVSPWHVGMLKYTAIAIHITTIATAKHIHNYAWYLTAIYKITITTQLVTLLILIQQSVNVVTILNE